MMTIHGNYDDFVDDGGCHSNMIIICVLEWVLMKYIKRDLTNREDHVTHLRVHPIPGLMEYVMFQVFSTFLKSFDSEMIFSA